MEEHSLENQPKTDDEAITFLLNQIDMTSHQVAKNLYNYYRGIPALDIVTSYSRVLEVFSSSDQKQKRRYLNF